MKQNIGTLDRIIRITLAGALAIVAWYWLGQLWDAVAYGLAVVLALTALIRWCPAYVPFSIDTIHRREPSKAIVIALSVGVMLLLVAGAYASDMYSKKLFIEEFNTMNAPYKQVLFQTGQGNREAAITNYDAAVIAISQFEQNYAFYRPPVIKSDDLFTSDVAHVKEILAVNKDAVMTGNLTQAHLALEKVRPIFNEMLRRNNLSLLSVTLVDFHDSMEIVLDAANAKDAQRVLTAYVEADQRLKAVEVELNDVGVQSIRQQLEAVHTLAEQGTVDALPAQAGTLKSSYVKVYLAKG